MEVLKSDMYFFSNQMICRWTYYSMHIRCDGGNQCGTLHKECFWLWSLGDWGSASMAVPVCRCHMMQRAYFDPEAKEDVY